MARIPLDPPRSTTLRIAGWYSRRRFGATLEPALAMAHNKRVFRTNMRTEMSAEKWSAVPAGVKTLAVMSAAATIGCEWCIDFGYWIGMTEGLDPAKVRDVPRWRESSAYTAAERAAIDYAAAMSTTPVTVTDAHLDALRPHFDEGQLVELTAMIALENQRARFNSALGLTSQGFAERCEIAPA